MKQQKWHYSSCVSTHSHCTHFLQDMASNSIKLYDEALAMWHIEKGQTNQRFTGDFLAAEIQGVRSADEASLIVSLLTSKAAYYEKERVMKVR